jgi:hypothetical protein
MAGRLLNYENTKRAIPMPKSTATEHEIHGVGIPRELSELEETFALQLRSNFIVFEREYKFYPSRNWRVDFLILEYTGKPTNILVDMNGGTWMSKSGHNTGNGIARDYEKSNAAQLMGFIYLQFTGKELDNLVALDTIKRLLKG